MDTGALDVVFDYHERTKHHLNRYARSLGYMDWATQPSPFRTFDGAPRLPLDHPPLLAGPAYDDLYAPGAIPPQPLDRAFVSRLFYDSLALSAWKQAPGTRAWSLRVNPSSGALHPNEGYLITGLVPGLTDGGVFHYAPYHHALEQRRPLDADAWAELTGSLPGLFVGLTSIWWREAWKYGERAFRYCHHDVGHAIACVALAARTLGWHTRLVDMVDDDLAHLLGTHTQAGPEAEHPDALLHLSPTFIPQPRPRITAPRFRAGDPASTPNRLSKQHHDWPVITAVGAATRRTATGDLTHEPMSPLPSRSFVPLRPVSAQQIIRQRRSAVDMDGKTSIPRDVFFHLLARTVPTLNAIPHVVLPWPPAIALALFVHRVDDVPPGLYLLARDDSHTERLRPLLRADSAWRKPDGCPGELGLYLLVAGNAQRTAKLVSCQQDIAADGAFAVAMLADFDATLRRHGASFYPRLYWEAGLVGQVLYLEAEAAGVRSTGIGCFFDDATHELLGLQGRDWQSLYHFTVGGPVDDPRLKTIPPYQHLSGE